MLDFLISVLRFWKALHSTTSKGMSDTEPHRQNMPAVVWKDVCTGGCCRSSAPSNGSHNSLRARTPAPSVMFRLLEPDVNQGCCGLRPEYLSALALLAEWRSAAATLFATPQVCTKEETALMRIHHLASPPMPCRIAAISMLPL